MNPTIKNPGSEGKLNLTTLAIIIASAASLLFISALSISGAMNSQLATEPIPEQITSVNTSLELDLSEYFSSEYRLWFSYSKSENFIVMFGDSLAEPGRWYRGPTLTLLPLRDWTGEEEIEFRATDGKTTVNNSLLLRVLDIITTTTTTTTDALYSTYSTVTTTLTTTTILEAQQLRAEINKPVKWVKRSENNTIPIPENAYNISVTKIVNNQTMPINKSKIKVKHKGKLKDLDDFEIDKQLERLHRELGTQRTTPPSITTSSSTTSLETTSTTIPQCTDSDGLNSLTYGKIIYNGNALYDFCVGNTLYEKWCSSGQPSTRLFYCDNLCETGTLDGNSVGRCKTPTTTTTTLNGTTTTIPANQTANETLILINETADAFEVTYETDPPIATEEIITLYNKKIIISSETSYTNILAYTDITETPGDLIKLYWYKDDVKTDVTNDNEINLTFIDSNGNNLIDRLEWNIPHLSNQTFEVSITILNVQSYPTVGGKWTVKFTTTGQANLTISAVDETSFAEIPDDPSTVNDLQFLELRAGNTTLTDFYYVVES